MRSVEKLEAPEQRDEDAANPDHRSAYLWWLLWLVFLPFGTPLFAALAQSHPAPPRLVVSLVGAALFVGLYLWTTWQNARDLASPVPPRTPTSLALWWPIALLAILALVLTELDGTAWGTLFIFTTAAAAGRLPLRPTLGTIGAIALIIILGGIHMRMGTADIVQALLTLGITGAATLAVVQSVRAARLLRTQREEMARRAAVTEERLRIARDLHDLLGHNLSVIALKSELARRLVSVSPERAAAEIGDVERVARQALHEVREAVAGYRRPSLASELAGAREILAAAGIRYRTIGDDQVSRELPVEIDSVLGWAVREGVTNVLRHSRASTCTLHLMRTAHDICLEIRDDGPRGIAGGTAAGDEGDEPGVPTSGNGLRGLAERAAALGGTLDAGRRAKGGFRLYMRIPIHSGEGQALHALGLPPSASSHAVPGPSSPADVAPQAGGTPELNGQDDEPTHLEDSAEEQP